MPSAYIKTCGLVFGFLGILFIPIPFNLFPYQAIISNGIFGKLIHYIAIHLFNIEHNYQEISSDSSSMYILILILFCTSLLLSVIVFYNKKWKQNSQKINSFFLTTICYYLALMLFKYGIDKVFKSQFYLPEPNILYTPLGYLDKDILFWSTMGTSYSYNIFMGAIQLLSALLLLVKRTRVIGLLLSCGIFTHIIAINFSFDISVKLYSIFLLMISLLILSPNFYRLYKIFILNRATRLTLSSTSFSIFNHSFRKGFLKTFVILFILLEALFPYLESENFNDDYANRPFLHGAYAVEGNLETPYLSNRPRPNIQRFFIHRNGYIIFQDNNNLMTDYRLTIDNKHFILTDYSLNQQKLTYQYSEKDKTLTLQGIYQGVRHQIKGKVLDWKSLPVMRNKFHWTVD